MKIIELTDDEFEILKEVFSDWGSDCLYTDVTKWRALGEKLGFLEPIPEPIPEPTPEEIKCRKEFAEKMKPIMEASNYLLEDMIKNFKPVDILYGTKNIGGTLRIKFPNDYLDNN